MGTDKLWLDLWGHPLIGWTLEALIAAELFSTIVVVTPEPSWPRVRRLFPAGAGELRLVEGGVRRQDSVRLGLHACADVETICVHDAARPLAAPGLFAAVVAAARRYGAATTAIPLVDTVKRVDADTSTVSATLDRTHLVAVQTPQAFTRTLLEQAHAHALSASHSVDDDAALVELLGLPVHVLPGAAENFKVTRPVDLVAARAWIDHLGRRRHPAPAPAAPA